ncbi:MAG: TIGR03862 family flavoprotein [Methylococcaceae bacterium]|nr:TIGR03862 family flavoprotein [Methylococcaceae bacterium]
MSSQGNIPVVSVIGGGPAGLMAAEVLSQRGVQVDVYDAMPSVGRKLLMAGKGGLNLSHSEPFEQFISCYGLRSAELRSSLEAFGPEAIRNWARGLGIETFVGTSGRIFPVDMKAAPLLRAWLRRLRQTGVTFHMKHQWSGWCDNEPKQLAFLTPDGERCVQSDAVILALGGASWPKLGSTGAWVPVLTQCGVDVAPLKPSNCGFDVNWSEHFRQMFAGQPLKSIVVSFCDVQGNRFARKGELILTANGLEGGIIYALSAQLRDQIEAAGYADITIDLLPDIQLKDLTERMSVPRGKVSMANHLRKKLRLDVAKTGLLREILPKNDFAEPLALCSAIKALSLRLIAARPIEEAISSAGGVTFEALGSGLMVKAIPGVFCAGEMLDWEAATGGYLLTACFSTGRKAAQGVLAWLQSNHHGESE